MYVDEIQDELACLLMFPSRVSMIIFDLCSYFFRAADAAWAGPLNSLTA